MDATLNKSDAGYTLALERHLAHSPQKVWRAITEKDLLHQWFPAHVIGEWTVGAELRFEFQHGEGDGLSEEELRGEVLAVEPERLLEFRWGEHVLRCDLAADGDGCLFRLSETFADPSWGARDGAGWEFCLENLQHILEGTALAKFVVDTWRERFQHYVEKFTPQFGRQAPPPETFPDFEAEAK